MPKRCSLLETPTSPSTCGGGRTSVSRAAARVGWDCLMGVDVGEWVCGGLRAFGFVLGGGDGGAVASPRRTGSGVRGLVRSAGRGWLRHGLVGSWPGWLLAEARLLLVQLPGRPEAHRLPYRGRSVRGGARAVGMARERGAGGGIGAPIRRPRDRLRRRSRRRAFPDGRKDPFSADALPESGARVELARTP